MVGLEKVQHKFLLWLAVNSKRPSASLDYAHLLKHFEALRISDRSVKHDFTFLHGVFSRRFDSAGILDMSTVFFFFNPTTELSHTSELFQ